MSPRPVLEVLARPQAARSLYNFRPPPGFLVPRRNVSFRKPGSRARLRPHDDPMNPRNPLDDIAMRRAHQRARDANMRGMKRAGLGSILTIAATALVIWGYETFQGDSDGGLLRRKGADRSSPTAPANDSVGPDTVSALFPTDKADASDEAEERFRGKPVQVRTRGDRIVATDADTGAEVGELVPTGTSSVPHFPKTMNLPRESSSSEVVPGEGEGSEEEYTLLGLGIRTVSFLSIQVYVVGLYVRTADLQPLQSALIARSNPMASALIPAEKEQLQKTLLDPTGSQELWDTLLRPASSSSSPISTTKEDSQPPPGIKSAIRIAPTRNTDFAHLRDGFARMIAARSSPASTPTPTPTATTPPITAPTDNFDDPAFASAVDAFKSLFRLRSRAPKGSVLLLARDATAAGRGRLTLLYQEPPPPGEKVAKEESKAVRLGAVDDERVGRLVWLGYLAGKNVSSEPARKSVAEGVVRLVERPAGTVADARVL